MNLQKIRRAYHQQKSNAAARGIEWQFTYETWLAWWGDDVASRGVHPLDLQMQRIADTGPYHPDNVRKGTPQTNADTRARMTIGRESQAARAAILAAEMAAPCADSVDHVGEPDSTWPSRRFCRLTHDQNWYDEVKHFFFCTNCQSEKPIAKRTVHSRYRVICADCVAKKEHFNKTGQRFGYGIYDSKSAATWDRDGDEPEPIPLDIVAAHREAAEEW